jgi:hypothetical protein
MTLALPRSNWQIQENRHRDETTYVLTRTYEFADPRAPATASTLKIACPVGISPAGHIHSYVNFELRPHVYLGLGQLPPPEEGMITAPFSVWLIIKGEGTEASPLMQGGACKMSWYSMGDDEPDDPELALMSVISMDDEIQCLRVLASGKEMTLTIMGDTEPSRKLQLRLPNGGEFRRLWDDVCKRLRREYESRGYVRESRDYRQPSRGDGLMGFLGRLFR